MPRNDNELSASPVEIGLLRQRCDPGEFAFETTADLEDLDIAVGQSRALTALEFGARMQGSGYNLYVLGPAGSDNHRTVQDFLGRHTESLPPPSDWCYLNNFSESREPIALRLRAGRGVELRNDMIRLVEELSDAIPAAFESEHYRNRVAEINQEFEDRHKSALEGLQERAKQHDMALVQTPHGFAIAPTRHGKLLADEKFEGFSEKEKRKTNAALEEMSEQLRIHLQRLPEWQKEHRERIKSLNREFTEIASGRLIDQIEEKYETVELLKDYFKAVREDVLEHARGFHRSETQDMPGMNSLTGNAPLNRYQVNVIVDHSGQTTAPVVYENNPSFQNLLGKVEHSAQLGALVTDFTMIRPGALHKANNGFLILDADQVLTQPFAWSALKRALYSRQLRIESLGQMTSLISTVSLEPEPIPLDTKIILIGDRLIYYLLCQLDPDFGELFKVAADFEDRVDRSTENVKLYARLIATIARREQLLPLSKQAVARVIEHCARLAGDAAKLTARLRDLTDLLRETNYCASQAQTGVSSDAHVDAAIAAQAQRNDRVREQTQEQIRRNNILIDTEGSVVAQVNGLSVLQLGGFSFGQPSRITATVRIGTGGIVDIERETELGGPIHSKAVLIVSSYLSSRYATDVPLSLSASLVFEQSYGGVEGDSASVAEICALLSALSGVPIKQCYAVTGSINQHGNVQVIGGVNEKIEGFFDICKQRGLSGDQGVLIPADNVKHLMLNDDVLEAAAAGEFSVRAIRTVDQAISVLTGIPAGERGADGLFPEDSVNALVEQRLRELASLRRSYSGTGGTDKLAQSP